MMKERIYAKLFSPEDVSADYKITLDVYNNLDNGIREAKDKRVNVANSTEFFAECLEVIAEAYEKVDIMQIESV